MRAIRPKEEDNESPISPNFFPELPQQSQSKRRCISSACLPCRKRKSKCDGTRPYCSTCTAVYHTECAYDVDSDHRRKAALKRDIQNLKEQNGALGIIIASIKSGSDSDVQDIVQQIRADDDLEGLAESLKRNIAMAENSETAGAEGELAKMIGRSAIDEKGVTRHFGHTSNLGFYDAQHTPALDESLIEEWTTVTKDRGLIGHLLDLYFCWIHPYYRMISEVDFMNDMNVGRQKYCTPLLLNAVLAMACHYTDRTDPVIRRDASNPSTAGDYFFEEAKRHLAQDENPCLTTVQALNIMGLREPSAGRDSTGFAYTGRAVRMAIELGLHLDLESRQRRWDEKESEIRKVTFWGLFTTDTAWAITIGRPTVLTNAAINVKRTSILDGVDSKIWIPQSDWGVLNIPGTHQPRQTSLLQQQLVSLAEIVNDAVVNFYAPRERFTSRRLLDIHKRFQKWMADLPSSLHLREVTLPHILELHMYYHTMVINIFRPFLKVNLVRSDLSPREVCTSSATKIARLMATFRQTYGFRRSIIMASYFQMTANIIDLINLPNPTAAQNLALGVTVAREGSVNHGWFAKNVKSIFALCQQWKIQLPAAVVQAAQFPSSPFSPTASTISSFPKARPSVRRIQETRAEQVSKTFDTALLPTSTFNGQPSLTHPADELFWSPFPEQGLPLQATPQSNSPMDLATMVDFRDGSWDQLNRDGFKMADLSDSAFGQGVAGYANGNGATLNGAFDGSMNGGWVHA